MRRVTSHSTPGRNRLPDSRRFQTCRYPIRIASVIQNRVNINAIVLLQVLHDERKQLHKHR